MPARRCPRPASPRASGHCAAGPSETHAGEDVALFGPPAPGAPSSARGDRAECDLRMSFAKALGWRSNKIREANPGLDPVAQRPPGRPGRPQRCDPRVRLESRISHSRMAMRDTKRRGAATARPTRPSSAMRPSGRYEAEDFASRRRCGDTKTPCAKQKPPDAEGRWVGVRFERSSRLYKAGPEGG